MKEYRKPEVVNIADDIGRAFPAIGLALAGGYVIGKAAVGLGKKIGGGIMSIDIAVPESVIA